MSNLSKASRTSLRAAMEAQCSTRADRSDHVEVDAMQDLDVSRTMSMEHWTTGASSRASSRRRCARSYLDYAMSVIVGRALPDVRDGLKPVHRRVLYAMHDTGLQPDRPYAKCAAHRRRRAGQVPPPRRHGRLRRAGAHGPGLLLRYPLVDGQGNFGNQDGYSRRRHALHRVPAVAARHRDAARHRRGHRRLHAHLRRPPPRADRAAGAVPEPARQRLHRASPSAWRPTSRRTTWARRSTPPSP